MPGALTRIANQVAKDAQARVIMGFHKSENPYGKAWTKLVSRDGKPLRNWGTTQNVQASFDGGRLQIGIANKWAAVHQGGKTIVPRNAPYLVFKIRGRVVKTKKVVIPAREMVPTTAGGMPSKWSLGFANIARTIMREVLRG